MSDKTFFIASTERYVTWDLVTKVIKIQDIKAQLTREGELQRNISSGRIERLLQSRLEAPCRDSRISTLDRCRSGRRENIFLKPQQNLN